GFSLPLGRRTPQNGSLGLAIVVNGRLAIVVRRKGATYASHIARMNMVRRSHEHRALHGVSRAWHAAGHAAVVADAVVAGLRRTVCPPSSIDIAQLLALARAVPTIQPTKRQKRKARYLARRNLLSHCFFFSFL